MSTISRCGIAFCGKKRYNITWRYYVKLTQKKGIPMKKKIVTTALLLAVCASLSACSKSDDSESKKESTTDATTITTAAETTAAETTAAPDSSKLATFTNTLDTFELKSFFFESPMPEFFNDEQKKIYANADYIMEWATFNPSTAINDDNAPQKKLKASDGTEYQFAASGVSYDSFKAYVESAFTPEFAAKSILTDKFFVNIDGELYCMCGGGGGNPCYEDRTFELVSQSDKEIKFTLVAHMNDGEKKWEDKYSYTMQNTDKGWRFSEFPPAI